MQIVIDIPQEIYDDYMSCDKNEIMENGALIDKAIINGTPLPKGHGRLIDADSLNFWMTEVDKNYQTVKVVSKWQVDNALTVLEADNPCKNCRKVGEYCMTCEYE